MNIYSDRFIDLRVYQTGKEKCTPGHTFGPARRRHYLFHYILSGSGTLRWADTSGTLHERRLFANDGFLIFPEQLCTYWADMDDPWTYMWIEFDGLRVPESLQYTELSRNTPVYHGEPPEKRDAMVNEMQVICQEPQEANIYLVISHMYMFLACLTESTRASKGIKPHRIRDHYVRTALDYIERNYSSPIRIEDIADECGIDRSYFGKVFREAMGQSPRRFLLHYRMTRAASLLQNTDMPVAAVGAAVGYDNALHFSRAFKNVHDVSPREWRAMHRKAQDE